MNSAHGTTTTGLNLHESSSPLYREGETLVLHTSSKPSSSFEAKITHLFEPFTLSCVIRIDKILDNEHVNPCVLKLYDHRFAADLREEYKLKPYSNTVDQALWTSVKNKSAATFLQELRHAEQEQRELDDANWTDAENELFLIERCRSMYLTEVAAYKALKKLQGNNVPILLATVRLTRERMQVSSQHSSHMDEDYLEILGIVLEFIPGFPLAYLSDHAPRFTWQGICDQAIRIVHACSDLDIINTDIRPENFVVTQTKSQQSRGTPGSDIKITEAKWEPSGDSTSTTYRVVMIDFAQCQLRSHQESDEMWGRRKWAQDEEGAIGMVMQHRLKKAIDYDLDYEPSWRYLQWAPGEDDE